MFIVEDGSIVPNANSLVSVEEADRIIFFDPYKFPEWDSLANEDKEKLLVSATRFLKYNFKFPGRVTDIEQSLPFPRIGVFDLDYGVYLPSDTIPNRIKEGVAFIALWINENQSVDPSEGDNVSLVRSDEVEVRFDLTAESTTLPKNIRMILGSLGSYLGGEMRTIKIVRT